MDREDQKEILKWLLGQAYRAESHKKQLKERLAKIRAEMDAPMGAVKYNSMPKSKGTKDGAAEFAVKLSELEEKILSQISIASEAKMRVIEIIEFIPIHETARQILELRHIDMKNWYQIEEQMFMSRQQCSRYYKDALDSLLGYPEIQKKVVEAEEDYFAWHGKGVPNQRERPEIDG